MWILSTGETKATPKPKRDEVLYWMYEDFVDCIGGNKFLWTLLVGLTDVEAEVIAFDPEGSVCFRSETLQYYFVELECA